MSPLLIPSKLLTKEEHQDLRFKLDCFYADAPSYSAFQEPSNQRHCWPHIQQQIETILATQNGGRVSVLEVGAGRTGFAEFLEEVGLRSSVEFHAQDVTRFNESWLNTQADSVYFGDVADAGIPARMNIVFSTYVFEHVTDPIQHLDALWSLVAVGPRKDGSMYVFSPRYDLPGYLCPSARHLPITDRLRLLISAATSRFISVVRQSPQFLIQIDLAAFHGPFYLDSDAVHWVSVYDLRAWAKHRGARCETIRLKSPAVLTKDWIIKRFCTTAVKIVKGRTNEPLMP
jgi:hypothetical protein